MFIVKASKECGCFRKSNFENNISFLSKDDALINTHKIAHNMNQNFCGKHNFTVIENGKEFLINIEKFHKSYCGGGYYSR